MFNGLSCKHEFHVDLHDYTACLPELYVTFSTCSQLRGICTDLGRLLQHYLSQASSLSMHLSNLEILPKFI